MSAPEATEILARALERPTRITLADAAQARSYRYRLYNHMRGRAEYVGLMVSQQGRELVVSRPRVEVSDA